MLILVDNAVKYAAPGGRATLRVMASADVAQLTVEDTVEGIEPEHLPHLSERFYRVDRARAREIGGGPGLSIARAIAEAHGGSHQFDSLRGHGTTAILVLPKAG